MEILDGPDMTSPDEVTAERLEDVDPSGLDTVAEAGIVDERQHDPEGMGEHKTVDETRSYTPVRNQLEHQRNE
jgi:hypothetical protein